MVSSRIALAGKSEARETLALMVCSVRRMKRPDRVGRIARVAAAGRLASCGAHVADELISCADFV
jgi:hypothetical protein